VCVHIYGLINNKPIIIFYSLSLSLSLSLSQGHANVVNLIATGVTLLLLPENTQQLTQLKADSSSSLIIPAVEELLRLVTPTQVLGRVTVTPCTFAHTHTHTHTQSKRHTHTHIPTGESIGVCIFQANRDPQKFPSPHTLILNRRNGMHLAFGAGAHKCIGRNLARMETRIAIQGMYVCMYVHIFSYCLYISMCVCMMICVCIYMTLSLSVSAILSPTSAQTPPAHTHHITHTPMHTHTHTV